MTKYITISKNRNGYFFSLKLKIFLVLKGGQRSLDDQQSTATCKKHKKYIFVRPLARQFTVALPHLLPALA